MRDAIRPSATSGRSQIEHELPVSTRTPGALLVSARTSAVRYHDGMIALEECISTLDGAHVALHALATDQLGDVWWHLGPAAWVDRSPLCVFEREREDVAEALVRLADRRAGIHTTTMLRLRVVGGPIVRLGTVGGGDHALDLALVHARMLGERMRSWEVPHVHLGSLPTLLHAPRRNALTAHA